MGWSDCGCSSCHRVVQSVNWSIKFDLRIGEEFQEAI